MGGLTLLVVGGSTLLYCDSPGGALSAEKQPPISHVARLLTLPISLADASEVRIVCLPIGAGLLWLYLAIAGISPLSGPSPRVPNAASAKRGFFAMPRDPLIALTVATLVFTALAAITNDTWALSKGWCFYFASGAAWAIGLAALIRADSRSRTAAVALTVMALLAIVACILTFWHRSTLDIRFVRWPIGPLTITGCMAGVWAAAAIGMITGALLPRGRSRSVGVSTGIGLLVLGLSATLAYTSGRRSSFLGVAAALVVCASVYMLVRLTARRAYAALFISLIVCTVAIGAWLTAQTRSSIREVSGPIALRQAYYRSAARLIASSPLLGIGPDMTVCRVTTDLARERAEHPHVIHGGAVPALHSEWLQAALELGVPGGLVYLAIPLSVIFVGAWTVVRQLRTNTAPGSVETAVLQEPLSISLLLASLTGLTAVFVIEATSINLRGAVMPATFWTLVGLASGLTQRLRLAETAATPDVHAVPPTRLDLVPRVVMLGISGIVLLATVSDLQQTFAHAKGRSMRATDPNAAVQVLDLANDRFGAMKLLAVRVDRGLIESDVSRALRKTAPAATTPLPTTDSASQPAVDPRAAPWTAAAVATWEELVRRCPGYPGAGGFLGEALLGADRIHDARSIFEGYLGKIDPYDPAATLMYAIAFVENPLERIHLVRRGLRAGPVEPIGRRMFLLALQEGIVGIQWGGQVEFAADLVANHPLDTWDDPLAPETLRMEAVRLLSIGDLAAATAMQDKAANAYKRLFDENHPARRAAPAEIDAWKLSADVRFESDPGAYREAFERVLIAERFAVLSVEHEYRRNPPPGAEFVGGVVTPVETPDALAPLWRLSAKLHIAMGRTQNESITPRLLHAMTNAQRESFNAQGALFIAAQQLRLRLTAELVTTFQRVAPERRPPDYDAWVAELQVAGVTTQPATSAPSADESRD